METDEPRPPLTKWAVAAFLLSLVGGSFIAAWFAFKALIRVKEHDERGRGLAIAAMVLAFVVPCTAFVVLDKTQHWADRSSAHEASAGDCFTTDVTKVRNGKPIDPYHLKVVSCDQPHNGEMVGIAALSEASPHPDCLAVLAQYSLDVWTVPDGLFTTGSSGRVDFDRVLCFAVSESPMRASLRIDPSHYDAEQLDFLRDTAVMLANALWRGRITADDWLNDADGYIYALSAEKWVLSQDEWSTDAGPIVKALIAAETRALGTWRASLADASAEDIVRDATKGFDQYYRGIVAARRAFGLSTSQAHVLTG
jgi:hypothetical protein